LWCSVAAHLVTLGIDRRKTEYKVPAGWQGHLLERSSAGIYWLVMEREV
jgi:hypothetical protein